MKKTVPIFLAPIFFGGLLAVVTAIAQNRPETAPASIKPKATPTATPTANSTVDRAVDRRLASFEMVWRIVKEKHFDPSFGGLDWDEIRRKYEPRVAQIKKDGELYSLLNEMLGELRQSHFAVIPPEEAVEDRPFAPQSGGIGVNLQILDDQAVLTQVAPGSAAARAGLRPGFAIKRIDDSATVELQKEFTARVDKRPWLPSFKRYMIAKMLQNRIDGAPGTVVRLQYLNEDAQPREAAIKREQLSGEFSQPFGTLPAILTEFEAKRLENGLGYIRFNYFLMLMMDKVRAALREFKDAPGIIFDLRGNLGGIGGLAPGIAGYLETKQTSLGTSQLRSGQIKMAVFPQTAPYSGPVAVLIDGGSGSTTEIFAAGLQELQRAVIVGEQSAGVVLPPFITKLSTGALFQYAIADFKTPNGVLLEGRGVTPDIEIKLDRAALFAGRDTQLEAAVKAVMERSTAR